MTNLFYYFILYFPYSMSEGEAVCEFRRTCEFLNPSQLSCRHIYWMLVFYYLLFYPAMLGNQLSSTLVDDLREQENVLYQCVEQLENAETARAELVSQLREALQEHESKLEVIRSQLQVARGQFEQASSIRKRVTSSIPAGPSTPNIIPPTEAMKVVEQNVPSVEPISTLPRPPLTQPVVSYAPLRATDEESKKAAAAAVAAKLAASTSSAQMLTSVLSSLVAEEAASMNGNLKSSGFTSGLSIFSPEKRQKVEKPMAVSDGSYSDAGGMPYFAPLQQQPGNNVPPTSVQSISQPSQVHSSYAAPPPLPPRPPLSPANPSANQFVQSAGMMVGVMPYGYGANALPPPPPLPPHITMGLARPAPQPPQQLQPQPQQSQEQQSPASGGYYRPPGIGFYGQSHQPTTPPVPRQ
ncbi:regulation of nuclear pre-mRNA domain-containing protein 2-like [Tripterygium wilfordii]|uniref:Regulation of nuclear pre-mRNA domain-containing protein 2-like n=1 Tax=Tripterygium wilfordii TaxID=458696 RepID=A0A7J7BV39_TRIWF|nr:regulation of nuclear pre-mRNA domain-containing protein 2-like [Tripterygium wilfordii]